MIQSTLDQYHHQVQSILDLNKRLKIKSNILFIYLPSCVIFARSLIIVENKPSFHSRVDGFIKPNNSLFVTAFGSRSIATGRRF